MHFYKQLIFFLFAVIFYSCNDDIVTTELKDYTSDFDSVWTAFDKYYPLFTYKNIEWEKVKIENRNKFFEINQYQRNHYLATALSILKDEHIYINVSSNNPIPAYRKVNIHKNYNEEYLNKFKQSINWKSINQFWGWGKKDGFGYLAFYSFGRGEVDTLKFDTILDSLRNTDGIIIDLRKNGGGSLFIISAICNRFTKNVTKVGSFIYRDGPNHDDFAEGIPVVAKPKGSWQYTKKVVLLIGENSISAAEIFAEVFLNFENSTLIGDTTRGATIIPTTKKLDDGTTYMLPVAAFYNLDSEPLEWRGVFPDIYFNPDLLVNDSEKDIMIEKAIELIKSHITRFSTRPPYLCGILWRF